MPLFTLLQFFMNSIDDFLYIFYSSNFLSKQLDTFMIKLNINFFYFIKKL
jgi:hypothetical protein